MNDRKIEDLDTLAKMLDDLEGDPVFMEDSPTTQQIRRLSGRIMDCAYFARTGILPSNNPDEEE